MIDVSQWVAVFIVCGPYNICVVENDPQPYWNQSDCQLTIEMAVESAKTDLPPEYTMDGSCLKINSGIKL